MTAVSDILFMVSVLREYGVTVTFEPDWENRGNGQWTDGYEGSIIHHTGTPGVSYSNPGPTLRLLRDGRSDLSGPLCNGQGRFDGSVHIIAAFPANHAGASGGPSMGPLPVTRLFNPRVMGWEMDYAGNTPMSPEQYRTALVIAEATRRLRGRPSMEWTRGHAETSIEGKWDPGYALGKTINLAAFRADATNIQEGDDMAGRGDEIASVLDGYYTARKRQGDQETHDLGTAIYDIETVVGQAYDPATGEGIGAHVKKTREDVKALQSDMAEVKGALSRMQTGTGYTLKEIAQAVVAEFKKEGN